MRSLTLFTAIVLTVAAAVAQTTSQEGLPDAVDAGPSSPPPETPADAPTASGSGTPDDGPSAIRGKFYLEQTCSGCHAIGASDKSQNEAAPAFRDILREYPAEALEETLAEGIVTGHPNMPAVVLDPPQIGNVIAYLEALSVVTAE